MTGGGAPAGTGSVPAHIAAMQAQSRRRYAALLAFAALAIVNGYTWLMFEPIERAVLKAYAPQFTPEQTALLGSWQPLMYVLLFVPITRLLLRPNGLTKAMRIGIAAELVAALFKALSLANAIRGTPASLYLLHIGQMLSAVSSPVAIGAPSQMSAEWFPPAQRTRATACGVLSNNVGNAIVYLFVPILVKHFTSLGGDAVHGISAIVSLEVVFAMTTLLLVLYALPVYSDAQLAPPAADPANAAKGTEFAWIDGKAQATTSHSPRSFDDPRRPEPSSSSAAAVAVPEGVSPMLPIHRESDGREPGDLGVSAQSPSAESAEASTSQAPSAMLVNPVRDYEDDDAVAARGAGAPPTESDTDAAATTSSQPPQKGKGKKNGKGKGKGGKKQDAPPSPSTIAQRTSTALSVPPVSDDDDDEAAAKSASTERAELLASHNRSFEAAAATTVTVDDSSSNGGLPAAVGMRDQLMYFLKDRNAMLLFAVYAWTSGAFIAWTALFDHLLMSLRLPFTEAFVGSLSFFSTIGYVIGGLLSSYAADRYFPTHMKAIIMVCCIANTGVTYLYSSSLPVAEAHVAIDDAEAALGLARLFEKQVKDESAAHKYGDTAARLRWDSERETRLNETEASVLALAEYYRAFPAAQPERTEMIALDSAEVPSPFEAPQVHRGSGQASPLANATRLLALEAGGEAAELGSLAGLTLGHRQLWWPASDATKAEKKRLKRFRKATLKHAMAAAVASDAQLRAAIPRGEVLQGLSFAGGLFNGASAPLFYELTAEVTFPFVGEAVSGNLMSVGENIGALFFFQVVAALVPDRHVNGTFVAGMAICTAIILLAKEDYARRRAFERAGAHRREHVADRRRQREHAEERTALLAAAPGGSNGSGGGGYGTMDVEED